MPIVAGVFYKWNFWVSPIWSSIAMSLSSIIVVSISHLLSLYKFDESLKNEKEANNIKKSKIEDGSMSSSGVAVIKKELKNKSSPYIELV